MDAHTYQHWAEALTLKHEKEREQASSQHGSSASGRPDRSGRAARLRAVIEGGA